jgi:polar amino acid transport system substrate-binding protein
MQKLFQTVFLALAMTSVGLSAQSLTIYTEENPPLQIKTSDGSASGYAVEVVSEIQRRIAGSDAIQLVPWARGYDALQNKENVALFSTTRTAERNGMFQWVGPLFEDAFALYTRADSKNKIDSVEDAKQFLVGTVPNDVRDQVLIKDGLTKIDHSNDYTTIFKKLLIGRIDAAASSLGDVQANVEAAGAKMEDVKLSCIFLRAQLWIAFSKQTSPEVVKKWSDGFASMKKDGSFEKIFKKYFPKSPLPGAPITKF